MRERERGPEESGVGDCKKLRENEIIRDAGARHGTNNKSAFRGVGFRDSDKNIRV